MKKYSFLFSALLLGSCGAAVDKSGEVYARNGITPLNNVMILNKIEDLRGQHGVFVSDYLVEALKACHVAGYEFDFGKLALNSQQTFDREIKDYKIDKILVLDNSNIKVDEYNYIRSENLRVFLFDVASKQKVWAEDLDVSISHFNLTGITTAHKKDDGKRIGNQILASLKERHFLTDCP